MGWKKHMVWSDSKEKPSVSFNKIDYSVFWMKFYQQHTIFSSNISFFVSVDGRNNCKSLHRLIKWKKM